MQNDEILKKNLEQQIYELKVEKQILQSEVIELDDRVLFQDFGVYQPQYNFATIDGYKEELNKIRERQKSMIKSGVAAKCDTQWKVQGSEMLGKKMILENIKQSLRNFNIECDLCISKVKFSNYEKSKERIFKAFELQNKLNETNDIYITEAYYRLKIQELDLAYEYQIKKEEEKEERRQKREELREAQKVAREIEEKRKELEKEQEHYNRYLKKVDEQLAVEKSEERREFLQNKKDELVNNVKDVQLAMEDLDYREANHRAGYVYIISNIGAFGENIYKIGMTRRLEPEDRIAELSGASVPFKFDIHALIFSDDAPKLETALHREFVDKKVNLVNGRKEFFNVTLEEIKNVVQKNHDKTVEFVNIPDAQQYRETMMIRKKMSD